MEPLGHNLEQTVPENVFYIKCILYQMYFISNVFYVKYTNCNPTYLGAVQKVSASRIRPKIRTMPTPGL